MDLWTLFVENIFGGFWLSVIGFEIIFAIIMAIGGLSAFSMMAIAMLFLFAMAIGYGYPIITIMVTIIVTVWSATQVIRWWGD